MKKSNSETNRRIVRFTRLTLLILLILVLVFGGIKGWRIYQKSLVVYQDVNDLRGVAQTPLAEMDIDVIENKLLDLQRGLNDLEHEVEPFLWLVPKLNWVPVYGDDISNAPALLEVADHLVDASILSLDAARPTWDRINSDGSKLDLVVLTSLLVDAQPQLVEVQKEFEGVLQARERIQADRLSPRLRSLLVDDLDPVLVLMDDGLSLSTTLPIILGATDDGPKSYLILVQNEDELRPTGGFITTIGRLVLHKGDITNLDFEGVDNQDDWLKPYPSAPWQLQEYMNARVLILRDSNWSADFPTNVRWAKYLYSYNHSHTVDGVIAFDQQFLVMLLSILGPLEVDGAPYAITDRNAIEYMRTAKLPPVDEPVPSGWYRKEFISDLADAVLDELVGGGSKDWVGLANVFIRALDERHLLLQFDNPTVEALLAKYDWDNALRSQGGDFLMTTDTNIGFNKTNALMDVSLSYDVDLTDVANPMGSLNLTHTNNTRSDVPCIHWDSGQFEDEYQYPINRCYWNYLRVYKQDGVELLDASPHAIPGDWMLLGKNVPARVDILDEEIDGVQGYGTLLVVPGGESRGTGFDFSLPASVFVREPGENSLKYRLKVKKQPGTIAHALTIRVHLPDRAQVEAINYEALIQGNNILIETDLRTNVYLELVFSVP